MTTQTQATSSNSDFTNQAARSEVVESAIALDVKPKPSSKPSCSKPFISLLNFKHRFFITTSAFACFSFLLVSQLIVASSTLWLTFLAEDIGAGKNFVFFLSVYLCSLVVPYVPESFAVISCNKWKLNAFSLFIHRFVSSRKNDPITWNDQPLKDGTLAILNGEGQATLNAMGDHVYNCMYYFLNVTFNIVAIAVLIEFKFAIAYFISLVLVFALMKCHNKKQTILAQKAQGARIKLGHSLLSVWDNVLLGNRYSFNLWSKQAAARLDRANRLNQLSIVFNQWLSIVISLFIFLPSVAVSIYAIIEHHHEPAALTALMLTLPRLFLVLSYTQIMLSYTSQWNVHKAKLDMIENILKTPQIEPQPLTNRIRWSQLSFTPPLPVPLKYELSNKNLFEPLEMAIEHLYPAGRYTLRGANGSGKSTLLMCIKNQVKEHAFYLPTRHNLAFISNGGRASTGEILYRQLDEIQKHVDVKVILLDEWDANLDEANTQILSKLIDALSKDRCIIEIRHRV